MVPVSLMGTTARGRRFCFILDRSDSMATVGTSGVLVDGEAAHAASLLGRAQKELKTTLERLPPQNHFYIIYFDSKVDEMPGKKWLHGGKEAASILPWMMSIRNRDGTLPLPAFRRALALAPVPDAIFLLTDGGLFPDTPVALARMNHGPKKVPIHVLHLGLDRKKLAAQMKKLAGAGPPNPAVQKFMQNYLRNLANQAHQEGEALLKRVAKDSGGSYRFVAVFD
jgi:hypothetical protein